MNFRLQKIRCNKSSIK